jgi:two-component system, chemotaxis family, chemotaxis protein CheY
MTILIVEDNATNGMIIRHLAKKVHDGDITVEQDPAEALARCQYAQFDLLIVDQMMPGMTGIQFTIALRRMKRYKHVPVVMVTADHAEQLRGEALGAGVTDFLTKPVEALAFRHLISTLLSHASSAA